MIVNAPGSWTTPEIEIIQLASLPGDIAVPLTVKLNGPAVEPVNELLISSKILYRPVLGAFPTNANLYYLLIQLGLDCQS